MAKQNQKPVVKPVAPLPRMDIAVGGKEKRPLPLTHKCIFFLLAVCCLVYANTMNNGYVLDDASVIQQNVFVARGISGIPTILSSPYHQGFYRAPNNDTTAVNDLYRPLSLVVFAMERQFSDNSPAAGHCVNILFFAGCVVLLFLFLDVLLERKKTEVAFIASLLFAVHPIHTEVVANIKSLDELLCFFFAFGTLLLFVKYVKTGKASMLIAGTVCYFLSLLAKETSISFLGLIPFVFFFYFNENKKRSLYVSLAPAAVGIVYLVIRFSVLEAYNADSPDIIYFTDNQLIGAPSMLIRAATIIFIMGYYVRLLFIPYPLACNYAYKAIPFVNFGNGWVLLSLAVYLALIFIGLYRLLKYKKDPYAFGILFFLITIALFSNILFLIGAAMGDRFLFFPSAGFCLLVALLFSKWLGKGSMEGQKYGLTAKTWLVLAPVLVIFTMLTVLRNGDWKDNYTLFKTDLAHFPENAWLWHAVSAELSIIQFAEERDTTQQKRLILEGIADLQKSASIYNGDYKVHNELGNLYSKIKKMDSAEAQLKIAISLAPTVPVPLSDLGAVYFYEQKYRDAIDLSERALLINPRNKGILNNLGICYLQIKDYDSAILLSKRTLQIDPENQLASQIMAAATKRMAENDTLKK